MKLMNVLHNGKIIILLQHRSGGWLNLSALLPELPNDLRVVISDLANYHSRLQALEIDPSLHAFYELTPTTTYLPLFASFGKIIGVGMNYPDHVAETKRPQPEFPVFFLRLPSSIVGHQQPILRSPLSNKHDYEGELLVIIGTRAKHVKREDAHHYIAGYSIFNDVTVRDFQARTPQWTLGKNFDQSAAIGPVFVTKDVLPHAGRGIHITTYVNGKEMQKDTTESMLFDIPSLIESLTEVMTLEPGDVIATGTPSGVGFAKKPPYYLKEGDLCQITIEGIGTLENRVKDAIQ